MIDLLKEEKLDSDLISVHPEFGSWMVELVPTSPFHRITRKSLEQLAEGMKFRRKLLNEVLTKYGLFMVSAASVPNLGSGNYSIQDFSPEDLENDNVNSQSRFVLDSSANPHPRYGALMRNIRARRGEKVKITVPIYEDENTNMKVPTKDEPFPG